MKEVLLFVTICLKVYRNRYLCMTPFLFKIPLSFVISRYVVTQTRFYITVKRVNRHTQRYGEVQSFSSSFCKDTVLTHVWILTKPFTKNNPVCRVNTKSDLIPFTSLMPVLVVVNALSMYATYHKNVLVIINKMK